jgi:long-chain acyl-CoA synthetase
MAQETHAPVDPLNLIREVLAIDPAADAIEWDGRWLDWQGLADRIAAIEALIAELALPEGARVGVMLRNRLPQLVALYAVLLGGRCVVTVNPVYPDATIAADIAELRLPLLIAEPDDLNRPGVLDALAASGGGAIALPPAWDGAPAIVRGRGPGGARHAPPRGMIEMLTSGTSGKPKRVELTRAAFQRSFAAALHYEGGRDGQVAARLRSGVQILLSPITHIAGVWGAINTLAAGRKLVLLEKFRVEPWRRAVAAYRPLVATVGAAGLRMILDADVPRQDLSSLRALTAGAAPVDPAVIDAFFDKYGIAVLTNYGATEFAGAVAGWTLRDFQAHRHDRRGSAGRLHQGVEARIVDPETGAVLPPMTQGLLEIRSHQLPDPETWLRTTDLAMLSEDQFIWIVGRADAAIIRGGFKIHPADVARALETHPAVREAVVVAIPDARLGQVPAAAIMLKREGQADAADLDAHLRGCLLPYQVPVIYALVDDVPRTASMKPILPDVAAMLAAQREG